MAPRYQDLRDWLDQVDQMGELRIIRGAHWDKEMGALAEMIYHRHGFSAPALLFDDVPGYPSGYRVLIGALGSPRRLALTVGMELGEYRTLVDVVKAYRAWSDKRREFKLLEPVEVSDGPILENVLTGDQVDLLKFPVPLLHELDGGRYIGTADAVLTRDPDDGWVNAGTYRVQVIDRQRTFIYITPGKQGRIHMEKWFARGQPCPVVIVCGGDPVLFWVGGSQVQSGVSELAYAGALKGEPLEVIRGEFTGLPIPARAEIALEGFIMPDERGIEGPFGEWPGYYAGSDQPEPVVRIQAIYHRNDPILLAAGSHKPPHGHSLLKCLSGAVRLWEQLEKADVPGVVGVWSHPAGGGRSFVVIAIRQMYHGHSRQVGLLASQLHPASYGGRWIVVVDDDIDPSNLEEVVWAMSTRCDPAVDLEVIHRCWSSKIDPLTDKERRIWLNNRVIVDATIPFEKRDTFPKVVQSSPELRRKIYEKWRDALPDLLDGK